MGPFKCPDCGISWAGLEHRCAPTSSATTTVVTGPYVTGGTFTVRCTCSFDASGYRIPSTAMCPVHDVSITCTTVQN